jgi:hypothetical protein
MKANSRLEQFKALAYDAFRDAVQISALPRMQTAVCPNPAPIARPGVRTNSQVVQSASREEPRDPSSAVPKVKGSRVAALQARID